MFGRPKRIEPGPGQESVWDYPRPPRIEPVSAQLKVKFDGKVVADTIHAYRILETSHPPTYYISPADVDHALIEKADHRSFCEFKGEAKYWSVVGPTKRANAAAWSYANPVAEFAALKDYFSFYANKVDECWVGGEIVLPQEGDFYGGWITKNVVGPFKGALGTRGW